jgi:hypothetical protein
MSESNDNGSKTQLAVGSFKFTKFSELYENIKGRTNGFNKVCCVMYDGEAIGSIGLTYEKTASKERFVLELNNSEFIALKAKKTALADLKSILPKFKRVGSTAPGDMGTGQKLIGYIDIGKNFK